MNSANSGSTLTINRAVGSSMLPFLKEGDRVILKNIAIDNISRGDIIIYWDCAENKAVCHRLVRKYKINNEYVLIARSDARISLKTKIAQPMYLGKVVGILRGSKIKNQMSFNAKILNWFALNLYPILMLPVRIKRRAAFLWRKI